MNYVQPPSRSGALRRAAVIGAVVVAGWALATAGTTAYAADDGPGNSEEAPGQQTPEVDDTTPPTTSEPSTTTQPPKKHDKPKVTPTTTVVTPAPVQQQVQHKTIIRRYVQAPSVDHKSVASPVSKIAEPAVSSAPAVAPAETTTSTTVLAVEQPVEPAVAPSAVERPDELALTQAASTNEPNDMAIIWMLAAALSVAVVGLGLSMLLFHRFGSVGSHGRALNLSLAPVGKSFRERFGQSEPTPGVVTSGDLLSHTGPITEETPVVDLTVDTGEVPTVLLDEPADEAVGKDESAS